MMKVKMPETQKSLTQLVLLPQTSSNETATNAPVSFEEQVERNSEVQQTVEYNKDSTPTVVCLYHGVLLKTFFSTKTRTVRAIAIIQLIKLVPSFIPLFKSDEILLLHLYSRTFVIT